ncbi:MAG TPA: fibronectin type III domain-containing protein [Thermoleophilaceae bacterium]|nr:fibronectin type III domain-containing protein [Thermoleophilaceae bacterium]
MTTQSPAALTTTGAQLRAQVKTGEDDARYRFQWGTTTAYGTSTPWRELEESSGSYLVGRSISGLSPGTTYHYRVVASDDDGDNVVFGADRAFTTASPPALGAPAPAPFPTPAPPISDPNPDLGRSVGLAPRDGRVVVKRPGKKRYAALEQGSIVPVGSVVDASRGSLALTSALPSGKTQTGQFGGGKFTVRQGRGGYVDLYLRGSVCPRARKGVASASRKRRKGRRLFGRDRGGRFRTHGRNSHATVRGTRWMVQDSCAGTLTKVTEGAVLVTDRIKKKRVLVKAGGRYLARSRR